MMRTEPFEIPVYGAAVTGNLYLPAEEPEPRQYPIVLLCPGFPGQLHDPAALHEAMIDGLIEAGCATLTWQPRSFDADGDDQPPQVAIDFVDDASAILRWMMLDDQLDIRRVGLFGHGPGAVVASCLSRRSECLSSICLVSPATIVDLALNTKKTNGTTQVWADDCSPPGFRESFNALSPVDDLAANNQSVFLMHGAADRIIPPDSSHAYVRALEMADKRFQHLFIARADHLFSTPETLALCIEHIVGFFSNMPVVETSAVHS